MYDDLARTQRSSLLEQFTLNIVIPSVLLSLAIAPPPVFSREVAPRFYGHTWPLMLGATRPAERDASITDVPARLLWMPLPRYPVEMLVAEREGHVVVRVRVDREGHVRWSSAVIQAAQGQFVKPVRDALLRAEFLPATAAGHPTESWVTISVYFDIYVQ
jgi:TonB family protein